MLLDERLAMDVVFQDDDSFDVDFGYVPNFTPYAGPYTVDPTQSAIVLQTLNKLASQNITINPIPSEYHDTSDATITSGDQMLAGVTSYGANGKVTGNIQTKTQSDLTVSGDTVTAPAGFYASNASASVAAGTEGTPVATKGTVSNHAITVTPSVTNAEGYISGGTKTGTGVSVSASEVTSGTKSITSNGSSIDVVNYASVDVSVLPNLQPKKSRTFTPNESVNIYDFGADLGYDGIDRVEITVDAISKDYVGSNVPRRSSSDMTASGATVTSPAGYYENASSKSVASGTAGTPTASKSAVSNHAVTVTPSVTNTTGYITGGTKTGTAVSVSASELVSGDVYINSAGPTDVTNVQTAYVSAGTEGTPTATKGAVSQHSITVTPSVTNEAGLISGGTKTGTPVTVSASELDSGTVYIDDDGDWNVVGAATASVPAGSVGTPTATKSAVSNHSVTVTPSVTHSAGWVGSGTKTGTGVSVTASELVSGNLPITQNGTGYDVANYSTVSVDVAGGGGGFVDVVETLPNGGDFHKILGVDLSNDTVTAAHLEQGYTAHDATGAAILGTLVAGGGGLEYESGTWTTGTRVDRPTIPFVNAHEKCPAILYFGDATNEYNSRSNINYDFLYVDIEQVLGSPLWVSSSAKAYGYCFYQFRLSNSSNLSNSNTRLTYSSSDPTDTSGAYPRYWVKPGSFQPWSYMDSRYWNIDRTYKWIAVWMPT